MLAQSYSLMTSKYIILELTSEADYSTLQKSINKIFDWSKTWQLKLANDKCQHNYISLSTVACCNAYFVSDARRNLAYFQTPPANFLLSRPYAAEYCNSEKKLVKHRWLLYNVCHVWWTLAYKPLKSTRHKILKQEVKVIWQKAPHGGPIPRLEVTPGGRKLYHWIPEVGFPISVP